MTARGSLAPMERRIRGTVNGGQLVLDDEEWIVDGSTVTVLVDSASVVPLFGPPIELDANGDVIMTPELEADLAAAEAEADRNGGIPWETVRADLVRKGLWKP